MTRFIALILSILLLPVALLISGVLYASGTKNILFKQKRVGKLQKEFIIYKFTSMQDGKITPFGKYLRKFGLDELPQLINILKKEMAFVGPRPLTRQDIIRLQWNTPAHTMRWQVLPGITGAAQLGKTCNAALSLERDITYVKNKSIGLDIYIFIRSLTVPFLGKFTR